MCCVARLLLHFVFRDDSVFDVDDAVGVLGDVVLVGDENDGVAFGVQPSKSAMISSPVCESRLPVGSSARMMDGLVDQGARDGDALALAAGELVGLVFMRGSRPTSVSAFGALVALGAGMPA